MKLWIRVDVAIRSDPNVAELADRLGMRMAEAVGCCLLLWAGIAEHCPDGDISRLSNGALERMAGHERAEHKARQPFAEVFRELFTNDGMVRGWRDRQGKLLERAEKDRARKIHGVSTEKRRVSTPTERNGTEPTTKAIPGKPVSWPGEAAKVWKAVAPIPIPRLGKALKPVVDEYGWPDTKAGLLCYIELNAGKVRKVEWFVDDAVRWLELGKMPVIDPETRQLTARGKLAVA
jgi:hypothetical protein